MVVAHNLHLSHIVGREVSGGQVVSAAQQVEALDVELRDGFTHIADGTTRGHIDARQALQTILQGHVALAQERRQVVHQCIASLAQGVALDLHLLQRDGLGRQHHIDRLHLAVQFQLLRLLLVTHMTELQHGLATGRLLQTHGVFATHVRGGEGQRLAALHQLDDDVAHGFVLQVDDTALDLDLGRCYQRQRQQYDKAYESSHYSFSRG